ncbi:MULTISPECIES: GNAT family N-acetyltransferase [Halomicrobium]|uniref:GCN5-related N-acetyltransferase n=2 Tax=Halomicrobium mukohataei TaxID=57705 RepID=C7NY99_HALMD|nr:MULTISPECIES: GNAT family N-acetyltransferase [Halomicrobium]ACV48559.1 GCN5-related N-acetyltransferase [Halomicrobium mukohataei DSM 12286]QCD66958.1 GNAT family N-acetyltransferase [Halomicrobium mukohataei]QFR21768.1 GNAT family N-acetyltransferase [Halomicrobium sp. ZPS1]
MTVATPIERATIQDLPAIQRVADWSFHAAYAGLVDEQLLDAVVDQWYATERLREQITDPDSLFLVARRGGRVRGYANVEPDDQSETYYLSRLYVEPLLWGNGIGTELLAAVDRRLSAESLWLTVLAGNERAIGFYERQGFEYVTTETTTFGPTVVEEHVYRKPL